MNKAGRKTFFPLSTGPIALAATFPHPQENKEICAFSQSFFFDVPFLRTFVLSTSEVFLAVQQHAKQSYPEPLESSVITKLSQMYRGILLELCQNLKEGDEGEGAELWSNLEFLWHFCEVMFLSSHPELPILPYLQDWVQINFDQTQELLPKIMDQLPDLDDQTEEDFWSLVNSHVFHGSTEEAARLITHLRPHASAVTCRHIDLLSELLLKKPEVRPGASVSEFQGLFKQWQEECRNRVELSAFHGGERFEFLAKVLGGDEGTLGGVVARGLVNWYEYLVLRLIYDSPTITPTQLQRYAEKVLKDIGVMDNPDARDEIILSAMSSDIMGVMRGVTGLWDNPWFALHFGDLVLGAGRVRRDGDEEPSDDPFALLVPLRDHLLTEYGALIMEHPHLWQMGVEYLDALSEGRGRPIIRECLSRKNPDSEISAQKLLQVAERFGFGDEVRGICRVVCLRKLREGAGWDLQNGLLWALKAGDSPLVTHIVDRILFEGEAEIDASLLDSLKSVISCSDSMIFLTDFCTFRKCFSTGDTRGAVYLLCKMVKESLIPKRIAGKILLKHKAIFTFTPGEGGKGAEAWDDNSLTTVMTFIHSNAKQLKGQLKDDEWTKLNQDLIKIRTFLLFKRFQKV